MSEPLDDEAEVIDGVPVLPDEPVVVGAPASDALAGASSRSKALALRMPAPVQTVVAGIGGLLAGAAIVGFLRRRDRRQTGALVRRSPVRLRRRGAERGRRGAATELVQVVASRSLLVDVHLLGSRDGQDRG